MNGINTVSLSHHVASAREAVHPPMINPVLAPALFLLSFDLHWVCASQPSALSDNKLWRWNGLSVYWIMTFIQSALSWLIQRVKTEIEIYSDKKYIYFWILLLEYFHFMLRCSFLILSHCLHVCDDLHSKKSWQAYEIQLETFPVWEFRENFQHRKFFEICFLINSQIHMDLCTGLIL